jgi:hypothetical protein
MNKKATIGMALLVAMVLAKALLPKLEPKSEDFAVRGESPDAALDNIDNIRNNHQEIFSVSAQSEFLAAAFSIPDPFDFKIPVRNEFREVDQEVELIAEVILPEELESDVMPMDFVSNTGYGLWKNSSEKIITKSTWEGKIPLDNGNTITDNISKMFPRNP